MILPFSSGHLLGLRVFPETDFAPYCSVWHCTPDGAWSIYNDGPSLETTCPRWWGPALRTASLTRIDVEWTGPSELSVAVASPSLVWTMSVGAPAYLRALNAVSGAMPFWTWKLAPMLRVREWVAERLLGMGRLRFSFWTPSGQDAVIMPEEVYFIEESDARLEGRDLGRPVRLEANPTIGDVPLPTRPSFVVGQAHATVRDPEEYRRTRESFGVAGSAPQ